MSSVIKDLPRERVLSHAQPEWFEPMLAILSERRTFPDKEWLFEPKLDGVRCLAFRNGKTVRLYSRHQKLMNNTYPEIAEAIRRQPLNHFILDGEIVAFKGEVTSFAKLQQRLGLSNPEDVRASGVEVFYYVFDILYLQDNDVMKLNLRDRKALLRQAITFADPLRYSAHRDTDGEAYLEEACRLGWEGLIAKRAGSRYIQGRSEAWLKLKCVRRQEFVIGGFTDPQGARTGFGALLIGYYDDGKLRYAGKVGTGFNKKILDQMSQRLFALEQKTSPFSGPSLRGKGVHWVRPELVAEIGYSEWTDDGRLRHPRFVGLREDKPARDVVREIPQL